jgi:hypothetical protein
MATVAAVAAAAATVGSAAYSASQSGGGKGGGGAPGMPPVPPWEHIFDRGTGQMLDEERRMMEDAIAQGNLMQPEVYKLLGYEPVYDSTHDDTVSQLAANADAAQKAFEGLDDRKEQIKAHDLDDARSKLQDIPKGKAHAAERKQAKDTIFNLKKELRDISDNRIPYMKQAALAQSRLSDAQTLPRRVVGFKKLDQPADPTQSKGDLYRMAFDLENKTLVNALQGKEPIDATLKYNFDQKEQQLRESLRRNLGEDYETSSAGMQALANFDRERNEAFQQYNTATIQSFSNLTEQRANSLSNLTTARIQQLYLPSGVQMDRASALGKAAGDRIQYENERMDQRNALLGAQQHQYSANQASNQAQAAQIQQLGSNFGQGLSSAAGSLAKYLGNTPSGTTPNPAGTYDPAGPNLPGATA